MKIREAKVALKEGRLDEASLLLSQGNLSEFLPGKHLSTKVAAKMVARAKERTAAGETSAGWGDLERAEELGGDEKTILQLREKLISSGIQEATDYVTAGDAKSALARLARLANHRMLPEAGRRLKKIAEHTDQAMQLSERGHFAEACSQLDMAIQLAESDELLGKNGKALRKALAQRNNTIVPHAETIRQKNEALYKAIEEEAWQDVLQAAGAILEIAPRNTTAQSARRKAWKAIGMDVTVAPASAGYQRRQPVSLEQNRAVQSTHHGVKDAKGDTVTTHPSGERLQLWVDAVGGYLVCLGDRITLGQPSSGNTVDVPILADLSRQHAILRRDGGAYVLEPIHKTSVDGRRIEGPTLLSDGQVITLGESVQLRFRKPHVLSATARLEFVSSHRSQPSADGIILFADSCIMGPKSHSHIPCRKWKEDVVLFKRGESLCCRASGPFTVDGIEADGQMDIPPGSQVEGEEFSFSVEAVEG